MNEASTVASFTPMSSKNLRSLPRHDASSSFGTSDTDHQSPRFIKFAKYESDRTDPSRSQSAEWSGWLDDVASASPRSDAPARRGEDAMSKRAFLYVPPDSCKRTRVTSELDGAGDNMRTNDNAH